MPRTSGRSGEERTEVGALVAGDVGSAAVVALTSADTLLVDAAVDMLSAGVTNDLVAPSLLEAESLTFTIANGVFVNDTRITSFDLTANNGVLHVLLGVLLP